MQEEAFVKSQLVAFCKTLSKVEAPLKQKHVRALVVGTHKLRSSRIFWHAVSRVQLEKNPVLTWKFCQLLHKLIHDGHQKVTEESVNHISRLTQLGNFWQHLRSSGYGQANTCYCKLLVSRLKFHKKYPSIPGNLNLTQRQLEVLTSDVNETFELAIDMLDQMDELLNLKGTIMSIMDSLRWSSLVPQGQCLLSPLILVILDTSKLYDFLVKALFKLHTNLSSDTLVGHRERFYDIFRRTKKFYEETGNLQYFKYLVQIPTLPSSAPNFMQASELDEYQAPQAYLHTAISESGEQTPPDNQSVCDEQINTIIDLSIPSMDNISLLGESTSAAVSSSSSSQNQNASIFDPKDEIITRLQQDIDMERDTKEKVIQEARIRIEQYETRLIQMKQEIDLHKEAADERVKELQELRVLNNRGQEQQQSTEEIERKMQESEQKFTKLRNVYQQLREDHIKALTQIRDLRTKIDTNEQDSKKKEEELQTLKKDFEQISQERTFFESQAKMLQENVQTNTQALQASQAKVEQLESKVEYLNDILENEKIKAELGCIEPMLKELPNENSAELDAETMGKQLEEEMKRMTDAIAAAVAHIDELQRRSREDNSGLNLEVNDKILDACTSLMNAVRELVIQSKELQDEIVAHGGGSASPSEFYKRNHQWTEGLISAGRAVGVAATELVKSADNLIMGKGGKFEHLIVAAGSVGASVAQLFVSSRVKSDKSSQKLADLGNASKAVNRCTAMLVGAVKNGQQSLVVKKLLDFSNLSLHETKKEEMESQVKTLELEAELTKERLRLAALRKQHFHLAQLVSTNQENGDNKEQQS